MIFLPGLELPREACKRIKPNYKSALAKTWVKDTLKPNNNIKQGTRNAIGVRIMSAEEYLNRKAEFTANFTWTRWPI